MEQSLPNYLSDSIVNCLLSAWISSNDSNGTKNYAYGIWEAFLTGQQILVVKVSNGSIVPSETYRIESSDGLKMSGVNPIGKKTEFVISHFKETNKLIIAEIEELKAAIKSKNDKVPFNHAWMFMVESKK